MKTLLKLVAVLVILLIIAVVAVVFYIDVIAKTAVEQAATKALGVETTLNSADVGITSGEFSMNGLNVANPQGYDTAHFLTLDDGAVAVDLNTLQEDVIELPHLTLTGIDLNLEKKSGKANYDVILENLKKLESADPATEDANAKRFIIREVTVRDINVHTALLPIGGDLTKLDLKIDEIVLQDVGSDSDKGMLLGDLTGVLVKAIFTAIVEKGGGLIPDDILNGLTAGLDQLSSLGDLGIDFTTGALEQLGAAGEDLAKMGEEITKGVADGIGKAGEDITENLGDELGKIGDDATKQFEDAAKGLGDLLGGNKKDDE